MEYQNLIRDIEDGLVVIKDLRARVLLMKALEALRDKEESRVEFISYDGEYPNLCSGTLVIRVNGKEHRLDHVMKSGGNVWIDEEGDDYVEHGPWVINYSPFSDFPEELVPYIDEIERVVNENVPHGCCGGCI